MNRRIVLPLVLIASAAMAACGPRSGVEDNRAEAEVNANSTLTQSPSEVPAGAAIVGEPETGTNAGRPDSQDDLMPGTDGNTRPPEPAPIDPNPRQ